MEPTPNPTIPRKRVPPRPTKQPRAAPAPPAWERYSNALCLLIARETDEFEQYLMRIKLLKARYTPWKEQTREH